MSKLVEANERLQNLVKRTREEGRRSSASAIRVGVGAGSAFAVAYIENRYPENSKVFGVDLSLLIGVGATGAGALGLVGDKQANDLLEAAGLGALCSYAARMGAEKGQEAQGT